MIIKYKGKKLYGKRINNKVFEVESSKERHSFVPRINENGEYMWYKKIFIFNAEYAYSAKFEALYNNVRFKIKYINGEFVLFDRTGKYAERFGFSKEEGKWKKIVPTADIERFYVIAYDYKNKKHIREDVSKEDFVKKFEGYQPYHRSRA